MTSPSRLNYAASSMFMAHTMGNAASFVEERIKRAFVPGYFKNSNISTTMAYKYFDVFRNTPPHIFRKAKPFFIMQPRFDTDYEDYFMAGSYLMTRLTDVFSGDDMGNLIPLLEDDKRGIDIRFLMNRIRMHFDISMVFETQMEQLNIVNHMRNMFVWNRQTVWDTTFESHIPREIIAGASYATGLDMGCPADLLRYLNGHSYHPITYKAKTSTGNDEYFMYVATPLDVMLTNLSLDDGGRNSMVDDVYGISFSVTMEFTTAAMYHIFSRTPIPNMIIHENSSANPHGDGKIEIQFTSVDDMGIQIPEGWELISVPSYRVDFNPPEPDVLDIRGLILDQVNTIIDYHVENNIPTVNLIKFFVRKDQELLTVEDGDYILDLPNRLLYTYNLERKATYRLFVVVNREYVNHMIRQNLGDT